MKIHSTESAANTHMSYMWDSHTRLVYFRDYENKMLSEGRSAVGRFAEAEL